MMTRDSGLLFLGYPVDYLIPSFDIAVLV